VPVTSVVATSSQPRDNDPNSIMWGGCYTMQECFAKIDNGDDHGHSATNIQQIYFNENRGMTRDNFKHAVDGVVYKNGDVRVNGQLVATGARSIGRTNMAGSVKSGSAWERPTQTSFVADSIPAWVNMDGGQVNYFVIKSCGNWGHATPVPKPTPSPSPSVKPTPSPTPSPTYSPTPSPTYSPTPSPTPSPRQSFACVELIPAKSATQPADKNRVNFRFTITPDVDNVAITGYRFTFSDSSQPVDTDANTPFTERAFGVGTFTVNGQVKTTAGTSAITDACSATVTVTKPPVSPSPSPVTPSPTPSPTGRVLGAALPDTGPEAALGGMAGLTAIGFASRAYLRSRKSVIDAMRGKGRKQQ
jgi:hypothetical protein